MKYALLTFMIFSMTAQASLTSFINIGPYGGRFTEEEIQSVEAYIESKLKNKNISELEAEEVKKIELLLAVGKRASKWIEVVNQSRPEGPKLDLSGIPSTGGIPIATPIKTNTDILMKRYQNFLSNTTPLITNVVMTSGDMPTNPPVSDKEFVASLKTLDVIYQSTIRWSGAQRWISWYINRSIYDVRGYVFLEKTTELKAVLENYSSMSAEEKSQYEGWLLGLCKNGDFDPKDCSDELKKAISKNRLFGFYERFVKYGKSMFDLFFTVKKTRPEVFWDTAGKILYSPFQTPERTDVLNWLKENVEDEWRSTDFNLIIDYKIDSAIPRIQFKEGVTANVNGIAGDLITMSAEYPIDSLAQKWTIRHEYGHVLGLEDCYLEFYDPREKAMIYYEIDVDNLMCSRNGHIKPTHIEQLKKAYK